MMKEKHDLDQIFKDLEGHFDLYSPKEGHQARFMDKLEAPSNIKPKSRSLWKPLSIAASIALLCALGIGLMRNQGSTTVLPIPETAVEVPQEVSNTQRYFTRLVNQQIQELEAAKSPETQKIIDDTLLQLDKLEADYSKLEQDLEAGGNSKLILSAMITNFQTRITLLQAVMQEIETVKNYKAYEHENTSI